MLIPRRSLAIAVSAALILPMLGACGTDRESSSTRPTSRAVSTTDSHVASEEESRAAAEAEASRQAEATRQAEASQAAAEATRQAEASQAAAEASRAAKEEADRVAAAAEEARQAEATEQSEQEPSSGRGKADQRIAPLAGTGGSSSSSKGGPAYYSSCKEAKAAGAAPLHRGDPGYRSKLDRDGDGIACEK
ncbi:excalibur calcium-binding domain-containing protein [Actinomyces sp. zg328]|uniref:excalibur calcium-binding domain-containing protein n=1 Tax=Actinomyces sp. zg328 TaxID=2609287 RepID=UPI001F278E84|nr:excalibur calcium-binding domain-containing protein [Actinomyces sp. zg328]